MGLDPLVVHHAPARDLWIGLAAIWAALELIAQRLRRERRQGFDRTFLVVVVSIVAGVNVAYRLAHADDGVLGGGWTPVVAGAAVVVLGGVLRAWAIASLGRFFTSQVTIQEGHRVVTRGPYRYLRHPSYTAMLVALLGLGIALDTWSSILAIVAIPLAGLLVRIHVEERALVRALGDEYRRYAAETRRLVPGVW
jgi:protein-S-isoprenylcysteine O-methyltransferase Ste14